MLLIWKFLSFFIDSNPIFFTFLMLKLLMKFFRSISRRCQCHPYASNWVNLRKIVSLLLAPERLIAFSNARLNKKHVRPSWLIQMASITHSGFSFYKLFYSFFALTILMIFGGICSLSICLIHFLFYYTFIRWFEMNKWYVSILCSFVFFMIWRSVNIWSTVNFLFWKPV